MSPLKDFSVNLGSFAQWALSLGVGVTADGSCITDDVARGVEDVRLTSLSILVMAGYTYFFFKYVCLFYFINKIILSC